MQHQVNANQSNQAVNNPAQIAPAAFLQGTLGKLACKCSHKNDMDFLIKKDGIVCASCGSDVACLPPLVGVYYATCTCCASTFVKTTFVLDSRGVYTCTWCGTVR